MNREQTELRAEGPNSPKLRHEAEPSMPLVDVSFLVILALNIVLVPMALFAMGEDSGVIASIKYLLVGFGAAAAAYGVNRFAIDRLAPLHAIGFNLVGALAITAILVTGSGTALASFTGIIFGSVEVKTLQEHGNDLSNLVEDANEVAVTTERLSPAMTNVQDDIAQTIICERETSCLSERGNGGEGPMTRALQTALGSATSIVTALETGADDRASLLQAINRLTKDYNSTLADTDVPIATRRADLQGLHSEIIQSVSALREAMPIAVLASYAQDLQNGATLPSDIEGSRKLSKYLKAHGDNLADQMADLPNGGSEAPTFPTRPGMLDVLRYLTTYLAIAAVVIVGELVLPITLYLMTYYRLSWEIERRETGPKAIDKPDQFDGLFDPLDRGGDQ